MFPKAYFPPTYFPPSYWPKTADAAVSAGKGKGVGGKHYNSASIVQQLMIEAYQRENSLIQDQIQASFVFNALKQEAEWKASVEVNNKQIAEDSMYSVLLAEI